MRNHHTAKYIVGVDEAGRGPIAGPVTVAAVAFLVPPNRAAFRGIRDGKQLTAQARERYFAAAREMEARGLLKITVHSTAAKIIDRNGIVNAIKQSLNMSLTALRLSPATCFIQLDGSLEAPAEYAFQETIIRGDETELPITLAGIVAKVTRDREMALFATQYPNYGFDKHKGYGTKAHYATISRLGPCPLHRKTFLNTVH